MCDNLTLRTSVHAAVFVVAALFLGWRGGEAGLATGWVDPVARIQAQDEAVYASTALGMARG